MPDEHPARDGSPMKTPGVAGKDKVRFVGEAWPASWPNGGAGQGCCRGVELDIEELAAVTAPADALKPARRRS